MADEQDFPSFYANAVEFAMSPYDLTADFGFKTPEQGKSNSPDWNRLVRVSMSPSHAKSMLKLLVENITAYEERFGVIPSPHYDQGEKG